MASTVREIMNQELFSVGPSEPADIVLGDIIALGVTAAPVVDSEGRPIGMISTRDLVNQSPEATAGGRMSKPAALVRDTATIDEAGRAIASTSFHHLVVVDKDGRAVGMVSSMDVLRALLGLPAPHPAAFPHFDRRTGLPWTDDAPMARESADVAPDGPGVLVLVRGGRSLAERPVWAEACDNVRNRLLDLLAAPRDKQPGPTALIPRENLRFRAALVLRREDRERTVSRIFAGIFTPLPTLDAPAEEPASRGAP